MDLRGRRRGAGTEGERGASGRRDRGGGGVAALSPPGVGAGEAVWRERAPVPTRVGGTGKEAAGGAGPAVGKLGQVGRSGL